MSVADVSPETIVPDGKIEASSSATSAFIEEKLPPEYSLVEEVNFKEKPSPDKDHVNECESSVIHITNHSTNVATEISKSLNDGILINEILENGKQEKIDIVISTPSSNLVNENCKTQFSCSEKNERVEVRVLESCSDKKDVDNPNISLMNKNENTNGQLSNEDTTDTVQIIPRVTDLKESPDLQSRNRLEFCMLLQEPAERRNLIISENIEDDGTKRCNKAYFDVQISNQLFEDEDFSSPLRPLSPQSQLRDLCKRGDADQLENFLAEMCTPEKAPKPVDSPSGGFVKIHFTKNLNKLKIDLDAATEDGWTALHDIITHECQFTDVARVLLSYGANVNTQDIHGDSPLHSSLLYHNTDNIELLLKYSANVEATNASGRKPIHIANDAESLELLLKYGASVSSQDRIGNTPLHYAVVAKDVDRVKLLLEKGCDVDIPNKTGASPLHISSDLEIAGKLLNAAANPNATDQNGNIALHVAVKGRHKEWAKLLINWKGDPNLSNKNGKSPFNLAKDKEMKNILQGKLIETIVAANSGDTLTTNKKVNKSKVNTANATGTLIDGHSPLPYPPTSVISSPSILKRGIDNSCNELNEKRCRGPRLRFSDVNDYSGVEELLPPKRVKVRPIYSEPQFSSDDD